MTVPAADNLRHQWRSLVENHGIDVPVMLSTVRLLDAIAALHQPCRGLDEYLTTEAWCQQCAYVWPCPTARLLQGEGDRG